MPGQTDENANGKRNPRPGLLAGERIFIAEDEVVIAMELQSMVEDCGGEVVGPSHTLQKAVELAKTEAITAAILDLRLGRESIGAVARVLEKRNIPFFFYSGQMPDDPIRMEWPNSLIAAKPATPAKLMECFAAIIETRSESARGAVAPDHPAASLASG